MTKNEVHKNIFLIQENQIATYCYRSGKFELQRHKGEESWDFKNDPFWEWWQDTVKYMKNDEVDFCFLSSDKDFKQPSSFKSSLSSIWTWSVIEKFFKTCCEKYSWVQIEWNGTKKEFKKELSKDNSMQRLFLFLNENALLANKSVNNEVSDGEAQLYRHFKNEREKDQNSKKPFLKQS